MKYKLSILKPVLFHSPGFWIHNPVFSDARPLVGVFLFASVVPRRAGEAYFHNQVRRAMHAVALDLVTVADNHEIGNEMLVFLQKQVNAIRKEDTLTQPPAAVKEAPARKTTASARPGRALPPTPKSCAVRRRLPAWQNSFPYNESQAQATGLSAEDYNRIFRYESMKGNKSRTLAEEQVYMMKDGKRTFLKDIDEASYQALTGSLRDATAWNAPQMDAVQMILMELWGRAYNGDIESSEYTEWLNTVREHETAGGQGIQAVNKWIASSKTKRGWAEDSLNGS